MGSDLKEQYYIFVEWTRTVKLNIRFD